MVDARQGNRLSGEDAAVAVRRGANDVKLTVDAASPLPANSSRQNPRREHGDA